MRSIFLFLFFVLIFTLFLGGVVSAHEVYVLDQGEISFALGSPQPDFLATINEHLGQFFTWGLLIMALIVVIYFVSINHRVERVIDPYLNTLKIYAPYVAQFTIGLALFASGHYKAIFGVELPLDAIVGSSQVFMMSLLLEVIGVMLILGIMPRIAGGAALLVFLLIFAKYGIYTINYFTYAGEALTVFLFGEAYALYKNKNFSLAFTKKINEQFHKYKFFIIRIFFGSSLIYASLYAKFIHGALALETVAKYNLTNYFPFDPVFLVLGAMLTEVLLGLCFLLGFEIRFASIFFMVFLILSLTFFGEAVWPHIILIGTAVSMFMHGYDKYCLSVKLTRKHDDTLEPVL